MTPRQVERAYCVTDWSYGVYHVSRVAPIQDDSVFRVFAIRDADATNAGPSAVDFECPSGMPELHIHTPTTCMGDDMTTCVAGGLNGIFNTLLGTVEPGQEVVLCDPIYAGLVNRIRLAGGIPRFVRTTPTSDGWTADPVFSGPLPSLASARPGVYTENLIRV